VSRDFLWHRLMIFLGQFVFRPGVQLQIKRTERRHPIVQHLEHLVGRHSVRGDFERKIIRILHLFRHAVPQIPQLDEVRFQSGPGFLRRFPNCLALVQVIALLELVVDVIRGDLLTIEFELETVEDRRLFRFGLHALRNKVRICHRAFRRV
jgi:hypothetical protein